MYRDMIEKATVLIHLVEFKPNKLFGEGKYLQLVLEDQGNHARLSVQEDQQYHGLQQYPEVRGYLGLPK